MWVFSGDSWWRRQEGKRGGVYVAARGLSFSPLRSTDQRERRAAVHCLAWRRPSRSRVDDSAVPCASFPSCVRTWYSSQSVLPFASSFDRARANSRQQHSYNTSAMCCAVRHEL
ncbi:unnamed protein product [Laminaria digitata]